MRATWLTDVHLTFVVVQGRLQKLFDAIRAENPDVLLVTGDTGEAPDVFQHLEALHSETKVPVYYVLGNHDFYGSNIAAVRALALKNTRAGSKCVWLPSMGAIPLTDNVVLVGVDGWGDARCGNVVGSPIRLNDWRFVRDVHTVDGRAPIETLQLLGTREATLLRNNLKQVPAGKELIVLTHVPPFPEAAVYNGRPSDGDWAPWFTCIATGEVLMKYAQAHPETKIRVLCGHTHGTGTFQPLPNLTVLTGGWAPKQKEYGNPIVQTTFELP